MFNFDTTVNLKTKTYEIKNNSLNSFEFSNSRDNNEVLKNYLDNMQKQLNNFSYSTFDSLVQDLNYLIKARSLALNIKSTSCQNCYSKTLENFQMELDLICNSFISVILTKHSYSIPEQLIILYFRPGIYSNKICYEACELLAMYDVITGDYQKVTKFFEEIDSYDYAKHNLNKEDILDTQLKNYYVIEKTIQAVEQIKSTAGNDLVSWSRHKMSRHINSLNLPVYQYNHGSSFVREQLQTYIKHLKTKKVTPIEKKLSKKDNLLLKHAKREKLEQDELISLFKQGSIQIAAQVIPDMYAETILSLIVLDSLSCVKEKFIKGQHCNSYNNGLIDSMLIPFLETPLDKEKYTKITDFLKRYAALSKLSTKFFFINQSVMEIQDFITYAKARESYYNPKQPYLLYPDSFYKEILCEIPKEKFNLNKEVTYNFIKRMTIEEKETFIKQLDLENCQMPWDNINSLFEDISFEILKKTLLKYPDIAYHFQKIILNNKDKDLAKIVIANHCGGELEAQVLFSLFSYEEKVAIFNTFDFSGKSWSTQNYTNHLATIFNSKDLFNFTRLSLEKGWSDYYGRVITLYGWIPAINQLFKECATINLNLFKLDQELIEKMPNDNKKLVLKKGELFSPEHTFSLEYTATFFKTLDRSDILETLGDTFYQTQYALYLGHCMTREELLECAKDTYFIRHNLEILPYSFLKQFKNKENFKKLVGDRRDLDNKRFGDKLYAKLSVDNSLDFILED